MTGSVDAVRLIKEDFSCLSASVEGSHVGTGPGVMVIAVAMMLIGKGEDCC